MILENWTKLNSSSRNALLAALLLIGVIGFYNWMVKPHTAYLQAAERYSSVAEQLAEKNRSQLRRVETEKKQLEELQENFDLTCVDLFSPEKADEFFNSIQDICEKENCVMESLKFQPAKSVTGSDESTGKSYITKNRLTLNVVGRYKNIVTLISKLQQHPQRVWIDSLHVELIKASHQLKCQMTITIYVMHNNERSRSD